VASFSSGGTGDDLALNFNADNATHYQWGLNYQNGATPQANYSASAATLLIGGQTGAVYLTIPGYAASSTGVAISGTFSELGASISVSGTVGGLWSGTDVTSMVLTIKNGSNLASGSTFSLYGLKRYERRGKRNRKHRKRIPAGSLPGRGNHHWPRARSLRAFAKYERYADQ
jgi:hypothetical protein